MAKSTRANGPTYTEHELSDPHPPVTIRRAMLGRDNWPVQEDGGDSSASSEKINPSGEPNKQPDQPPVPSAANPSNLDGTASDAPLTDGDGEVLPPEEDPYADWSYAELQQECKERDLSAGGKTEDLIARLIEDDEKSMDEEE